MIRPIGMRVPTSSHYPSFRMENPVGSVDRVDHRPHHQTEIQCACPSADQELRIGAPPGIVSIRVILMQHSTSIRSTFREGLRRDALSRNDPPPPNLLSGWPTIRPQPAKGHVCTWMLANVR